MHAGDGWVECKGGAQVRRESFVSVCFLGLLRNLVLFSSSSPVALAHGVAPFCKFFGDRTIRGGRRSSVNSLDESSAYADRYVATLGTDLKIKFNVFEALLSWQN